MERADEAKESRDRTLSNAIVPLVLESGKESADDGLDVGKERSLNRGEELRDGVGGALLLDGDGRAGAEHGVVVVRVDVLVNVLEIVVVV